MAPVAESLRGPQHFVCGDWGVAGFLLIVLSLQGDSLWWEECAVLLPALRRGSQALLEARGLLA